MQTRLRRLFKDLRDELKSADIRWELRVITDSVLKSSIHDRWIISKGRCFNVPSPDTIERGQFSEIKETTYRPPFEDWWSKSVDIIEGWNNIQKAKADLKKS